MKVRELQRQLNTLDPDLDVICYSEDEILQSEGRSFRLFDIESVSAEQGKKIRLQDNMPHLELGQSQEAEIFALIVITSDF